MVTPRFTPGVTLTLSVRESVYFAASCPVTDPVPGLRHRWGNVVRTMSFEQVETPIECCCKGLQRHSNVLFYGKNAVRIVLSEPAYPTCETIQWHHQVCLELFK